MSKTQFEWRGLLLGKWSRWGRKKRQGVISFRRHRSRRLLIEGMESRITPAMVVALSYYNDGDYLDLSFSGDAADDNLVLTVNESGYLQHNLPLAGNLVSSIDLDSNSAGEQAPSASQIDSLGISGGEGNDLIDASGVTSVLGIVGQVSIFGDGGNDVIYGSAIDDFMSGGEGDDTLYGGDGNDGLFPGAGHDILFGGEGADNAFFGNQIDSGDSFDGGSGDDQAVLYDVTELVLTDSFVSVNGGVSFEHNTESFFLRGTDGDDVIDAAAFTLGNLDVEGRNGNDLLLGGAGDDQLYGDGGDDEVDGGPGNDYLDGGNGIDVTRGGAGDDYLVGYLDEEIGGGDGSDTFQLADLPGFNHFILTNSTYIIDGGAIETHDFENWTIGGTDGDDYLDASAFSLGTIYILGFAGNDTLIGGTVENYLRGDAGNDTLIGGIGYDSLDGGDGDDQLEDWGPNFDNGEADSDYYGGGGLDKLLIHGFASDDSIYFPNSSRILFNGYTIFSSGFTEIRYSPEGGKDSASIVAGLPFTTYVYDVDPSLSNNSAFENAPLHTTIGLLSVPAPLDANGPYTYSFVSGDGSVDNNSFEIVNGEVRTLASFNFEAKSSYSIRVRAVNGDGKVILEKSLNILVQNLVEGGNSPPAIGAFDTAVNYIENAIPALVDPNATATDVDSLNFDSGKLVLQLIAGAHTTDRLEIRHQGMGAGQVGVSGSNVSYQGVLVGSFTGGTGATPLTVIFNSKSTLAIVQRVLRNITYRTVSDTPATTPKTLRARLVDADGATSNLPTKTITVIPANDGPTIGAFDTAVIYTENAAAALVDLNATVTDPDSADFNTGKLILQFTAGGQSTDRLEIRNQGTGTGQVGVSGTSVTYAGATIGSFAGGVGTGALSITFNGSATPVMAQAVLRNVTYRNLSEAPTTAAKTLRVYITDGDGGTSNLPTKTITIKPVNDAPVIGAFDTALTYTENAAAILIDSNATITDIDSPNLSTGKLILQFTSGGVTTDRLEIRNQGTGVGQIGVSGANVTYAGTVIGTFTGGTTSLTITFNASATPIAAQALLRNITYRNVSEAPSANPKTIRVTLTDGDGGTSNLPTKTVTIKPVNDAPVIGAFDTALTYTENAAAILIDSNATITDIDSLDLSAGKLILQFTSGGVTTDRLEIRNQGTGVGQIGVNGTNVTFGGTVIGVFSGGTTSLTITFNTSATPAAAQALLRNITYRNVSEAPLATPKTIRASVTDGDGGTSALPTKTIAIKPVNDAPVLTDPQTSINYTRGAAAVLLATQAKVTDVDSTNFGGGKLTVQVIANGESSDLLSIRHQGTSTGQIGVSGNAITFAGVEIGTFSGGNGTTALTILFNDAASPTAVQALIRNLNFRSAATASTNARTVRFTLTDGDGGTSSPLLKQVQML